MSFKKSCVLCRNFISIYNVNRTLHGRAGIRILSSRAESISSERSERVRDVLFVSMYYEMHVSGHMHSKILVT